MDRHATNQSIDMQLQPRRLSSEAKQVESGAIPVPAKPAMAPGSLTPLEAAGVKLAHAIKYVRDCEQHVAHCKQMLAQAEAEQQKAWAQRATAQTELDATIEGK